MANVDEEWGRDLRVWLGLGWPEQVSHGVLWVVFLFWVLWRHQLPRDQGPRANIR